MLHSSIFFKTYFAADILESLRVKLKNPSNAAKSRELRSDDVCRFYCQHDIHLQNLTYALPSGLATDSWKMEKTTLNIQFLLWA